MSAGELDGRTYLITGGSSGLGLAAAHTLAAHGGAVAICGRNTERLEAAAAEVRRHGGDVLAVPADVATADGVAAVFDAVGSAWGRLDGLMNNAGIHTATPFLETDDAFWEDDFQLKVMAIVRGLRHAVPLMAERGGAILNVLSIYAKFQMANSMPSSVLRAAGLAVTNGASKELAPQGIRVNAALIGFVHSDQWVRAAAAAGATVEEYERAGAQARRIPLGRAGRSEEFAEAALYLLTDRSSYVTGTALNFDGGLSPVI